MEEIATNRDQEWERMTGHISSGLDVEKEGKNAVRAGGICYRACHGGSSRSNQFVLLFDDRPTDQPTYQPYVTMISDLCSIWVGLTMTYKVKGGRVWKSVPGISNTQGKRGMYFCCSVNMLYHTCRTMIFVFLTMNWSYHMIFYWDYIWSVSYQYRGIATPSDTRFTSCSQQTTAATKKKQID